MNTVRIFVLVAGCWFFALGWGSAGFAATDVNVQITSDNAYGFGWGSNLAMANYFGGVENHLAGEIFNCTGGPESYLVPAAAINDFLYVVTWSDTSVTQGLLARFQVEGYQPVYSGMGLWQVYASGIPYNTNSGGPTLDVINAQIAIANAGTGGPGTSGSWVGRRATSPDSGRLVFGENNVGSQGSNTCLSAFPVTCQSVMGPGARWMWYNRDSTGGLCAFRDGNHREFLLFRLAVAELTGQSGCTHSEDYWATHNALATTTGFDIPWPIAEQNEICSQTYLTILNTPVTADPWLRLARPWVAAELNRVTGTGVPLATETELNEAIVLLAGCILDTNQQVRAVQLADALNAYNTGVVGPGACDESEEEPTPSPPTPTPTQGPTATPDPTEPEPTVAVPVGNSGKGCDCNVAAKEQRPIGLIMLIAVLSGLMMRVFARRY